MFNIKQKTIKQQISNIISTNYLVIREFVREGAKNEQKNFQIRKIIEKLSSTIFNQIYCFDQEFKSKNKS